jgi:hypothetical protein
MNEKPRFTMDEIIRQVFDFFNIKIGDDSIILKATEYLNELAINGDFEIRRNYLWIDKVINVQSINYAIVFGHKNADIFRLFGNIENNIVFDNESIWSNWISAQGNFILSILKESKEEDQAIQHWINYENLILELVRTANGCIILGKIYDLKGLDFFLFHHMEKQTNAIEDNAMFNNAEKISKVLDFLQRKEEAVYVYDGINKRKEKIIEISTQFENNTNEEPSISFVLDKLRINAERFWNEYLTNNVWCKIHVSSRESLIDAFVTEVLIENKILSIWSNVVLAFAKVIEKELSESLFFQFIEIIKKADFNIPEGIAASKLKSINKRKTTFDMLKKCANVNQPPTLGQLVFVGKYWDDEIMDSCTNLFINCREILSAKKINGNKEIYNIIALIEKNESDSIDSANIIELRNASAHPNSENLYDWEKYTNWLKKSIGQPPKLILNKIVNETRLK